MSVYNVDLEFSAKNQYKSKNTIFIAEDSNMDVSHLNHVLKFYNSQDRKIELRSNEKFSNLKKDKIWVFTVKNVVSFRWKGDDNHILYRFYEEGTEELLRYWLLHTLLPMYLVLEREYYFLHAGAVSVASKPIVFMADSFGGKSTITDFFLKKGHALITDDKLGTFEKDEKFYLTPSFPFNRPFREVETLGIPAKKFEKDISMIDCIYILSKADSKADVSISKIKGIEKFKQLRFATEIDFPFLFKRGIQYLSRLLRQVNIYNIEIPWDMDRLDDVYNAIIEHQKYLKVGD